MYQLASPILRTLHEEHTAILKLLDSFETLLRRQGREREPRADDAQATTVLAEIIAVMGEEIGRHYSFEEEYLFPLFAERMDPGISTMLGGEHDAIRPLAARLIELAREVRGGGSGGETWSRLHDIGMELVEREVFHVQKEEMGFLPALDQVLDEEESARLAMAYAESKGDA